MRYILILAAVWLAIAAAIKAQNQNKALEAHTAGDYPTALATREPLAEQDNAAAQIKLGIMYDLGDAYRMIMPKRCAGIA